MQNIIKESKIRNYQNKKDENIRNSFKMKTCLSFGNTSQEEVYNTF